MACLILPWLSLFCSNWFHMLLSITASQGFGWMALKLFLLQHLPGFHLGHRAGGAKMGSHCFCFACSPISQPRLKNKQTKFVLFFVCKCRFSQAHLEIKLTKWAEIYPDFPPFVRSWRLFDLIIAGIWLYYEEDGSLGGITGHGRRENWF